MSKLELTDTTMDMVAKMSEGNPGAVSALCELLGSEEEIDPESALGALGSVLMLDTWEIYGSSIYVLWSDKCDRNTSKLCLLIRAVQLGFLPQSKLCEMAADQRREVDLTEEEWEDIISKVCGQLKEFKLNQPA